MKLWPFPFAAVAATAAFVLQPPYLITGHASKIVWGIAAVLIVAWTFRPRVWLHDLALAAFVCACASRAAAQAFYPSFLPWESRLLSAALFTCIGFAYVELASVDQEWGERGGSR